MVNLSEMRKKWSRSISIFSGNSLGFKLLSAFIVIIVVVLSVYTVFSVIHEGRKARKNLANKGEVLANLLSKVSTVGVFVENRDQLMEIAAGFVNEPDVLLVAIYNTDGKPLYVSNRASVGKDVQPDAGVPAAAAKEGQDVAPGGTGGMMEFIKPVILKVVAHDERSLYFSEKEKNSTDRIIGHVRIVLGQESLNREILAILTRNAFIVLIFIGASIALVYLRLRKITRPLETLTQKVKALGEGSEVAHVPVETMDEIGRLAAAFNTMLDERRAGREAFQKILMEIHDGIGGITTNISLLSELARKAISPESVAEALATISTLSKEGMAEIRSLMYSLDRTDMSWNTLCAELRNRGTRTLEPYTIAFEMTTEIEAGNPQPGSLLCLHLFRVYREALTNIIKHSKAKNVKTSVCVRQGCISLAVQDDGQGCHESALLGNGRGIAHIKARAAELGGKATITGHDGTRVWLEIPLSQKKGLSCR